MTETWYIGKLKEELKQLSLKIDGLKSAHLSSTAKNQRLKRLEMSLKKCEKKHAELTALIAREEVLTKEKEDAAHKKAADDAKAAGLSYVSSPSDEICSKCSKRTWIKVCMRGYVDRGICRDTKGCRYDINWPFWD
jgi:hypothetical protein